MMRTSTTKSFLPPIIFFMCYVAYAYYTSTERYVEPHLPAPTPTLPFIPIQNSTLPPLVRKLVPVVSNNKEQKNQIKTTTQKALDHQNAVRNNAVSTKSPIGKKTQSQVEFKDLTYREVIEHVASHDGVVLLALLDGGFMEMAINFYITCIAAHHMDNYLLIATDNKTCDHLTSIDINCYVYRSDKDAGEASVYHSVAFLRKMNIRTDMILDVLNMGYTVLHSDIDMYCYKHPVEKIDCKMGSCDIAALKDTFAYNAGFLYINPTAASKAVYKRMRHIAHKSPKVDDQAQLNTAIKEQTKANRKFHAVFLNTSFYQCGKVFFEDPKRYFAGKSKPCGQCVVVHNNWIVSMQAKVYRAKEMHQWMYDGKKYYSDSSRKYLSYDNPLTGSHLNQVEIEALRDALAIGQILNRTVILPKFHCSGKFCPLNSILRLIQFDKEFGGRYREHSFLTHPLVPEAVTSDQSAPCLITSEFVVNKAPQVLHDTSLTTFEPHDNVMGMNEEEVKLHLGDVDTTVLHFYALYDAFSHFSDEKVDAEFRARLHAGIRPAGYRQY